MKVLIASSICPKAIERLREKHDVLCAFGATEAVLKSLIKDREILICRSGVRITAEVLKCAPKLKLLVRAGSGTDNVDVDYLDKRGIPFLRIAEPGAQAVAEMSFALMLALARNLMQADSLTRKGRWAKEQLIGCSLSGKVLGIVGAGNIGARVGELGAAWGMVPIGCVESPTPTIGAELRGKGIQLASFDEVVSQADFLSIHVPLSDSTHKLIGADVLSRMKVGAFLINLARGGVVDEKALYEELTEGTRLRGAALDVHESEGEGKISPLAALANVILTPHIGAMTSDAQSEIGRRVNAIIDSFMNSYPVLTGQESVLSFGFSHEGLAG
jgi:D-3-phosphoglycerate dehydrogenase / 2-oxoglutarate reductase